MRNTARTINGKVPVQVRFTEDVYERVAREADKRGVTVATYVAWVAAESSMTSQTFSDAIKGLPSALLTSGPQGGDNG